MIFRVTRVYMCSWTAKSESENAKMQRKSAKMPRTRVSQNVGHHEIAYRETYLRNIEYEFAMAEIIDRSQSSRSLAHLNTAHSAQFPKCYLTYQCSLAVCVGEMSWRMQEVWALIAQCRGVPNLCSRSIAPPLLSSTLHIGLAIQFFW